MSISKSKVVEKLESLLADAVANALTDNTLAAAALILQRSSRVGMSKPYESTFAWVSRLLPEILIPWLETRIACERDPELIPRVHEARRKLIYSIVVDTLLPKIKVGEGVGQARKLVRWAAHAYINNDDAVLDQLKDKLEAVRQRTKNPKSYGAMGTAIDVLFSSNTIVAHYLFYSNDGRKSAAAKFGELLREAITP